MATKKYSAVPKIGPIESGKDLYATNVHIVDEKNKQYANIVLKFKYSCKNVFLFTSACFFNNICANDAIIVPNKNINI